MPHDPTQCKHRIVRVMIFTALGTLVGCTRCNETFVLPDENREQHFTHFKHTSSEGAAHDYDILIHDSLL